MILNATKINVIDFITFRFDNNFAIKLIRINRFHPTYYQHITALKLNGILNICNTETKLALILIKINCNNKHGKIFTVCSAYSVSIGILYNL